MTSPLDDAALAAFLESQDSAWLAEQLMLVADEDPITRIRLTAAAGSENAADEARDAVLSAIGKHSPGQDDEEPDLLHRAVDLLEDLADYGFEDESADIADEAREAYASRHGEDDSEHLARLDALADGEGE
ncbi:hypothetical protein [Nocardiopsis algeriensis]|uniref:HEAT repeat protein n=1 Tax=Nocardiopsis algeriensis TaxID=1478215 RepID=A0A841IKZ2_9ACTN|nr:hypothetical protein [Nocardiopsis algeriensis]MBB6118664.1 hypothetical protein [Nocardiopsis algeriensis]